MRIHKLSTELANQIAAGEVIERPASIVKELLENSLDAGATDIMVEIEQGGQKHIEVRDNGHGIHEDDLILALDRHATSKISSTNDLSAIQTLGFRGEALASMSSVSRLTLDSRHQKSDSGWKIFSDGHNAFIKEPSPHLIGTSVIIRDLFYNTPARKKFLKNERVEFSHIEHLVKRIALSHPHVAFRLSHNHRNILDLSPALTVIEKEKRIAAVCGTEFLKHAFFLDISHHDLRLFGWIAEPTFSRSQADIQYFYVNRRTIKDKVVTHAIRQAYEDVLYNQRHPAYVLFLEIDPQLVDVNAHPTKHEVRFRESRMVHDFIFKSLHQSIAEIRPTTVVSSETLPRTPISDNLDYHSRYLPITEKFATAPYVPVAKQPIEIYQSLYSSAIPPLGYAIAQLKGIYILAENTAGLIVVDMHAAHERILYEEMKENLELGAFATEALLLPVIISVRKQEILCLEEHEAFLTSLGLSLEWMGPETLAIKKIPSLLKKTDIAQLVQDLIADLSTLGDSKRLQENIQKILGNMACKAAIKANQRLNLAEMNAILRKIEQIPRGGQCNHGRPTWIQLTLEEIDKFFLRGR